MTWNCTPVRYSLIVPCVSFRFKWQKEVKATIDSSAQGSDTLNSVMNLVNNNQARLYERLVLAASPDKANILP